MATTVGARPITAPGWSGQPGTDRMLIDCDVHQSIKKPDDLFPYLPRVYREQAIEQGLRLPGSGYFNVARNAARTDLAVADGCDPAKHDGRQRGDDYDLLREQHLDLWHVDHALLTGSSVYGASILPDPDFAAALCRAFNDWTLEHWIARDERLLLALAVSTSDPRLAVQEIDRLGAHPKVKATAMPCASW